jgi:hypothetical protein
VIATGQQQQHRQQQQQQQQQGMAFATQADDSSITRNLSSTLHGMLHAALDGWKNALK